MMPRCQAPISDGTLLDYWAHDLADGDETGQVEEHLFACGDCSARLHRLAALGTGLATLVRQGRVAGIVSRTLLNRMQRDGLHIRMYSLVPGETVPCAVFPGDDLIVTALRADFSAGGRDTVGDGTRRFTVQSARQRARVQAGRRGALGHVCCRRASDVIHAAAAHARLRRRHAHRTRQVRARTLSVDATLVTNLHGRKPTKRSGRGKSVARDTLGEKARHPSQAQRHFAEAPSSAQN